MLGRHLPHLVLADERVPADERRRGDDSGPHALLRVLLVPPQRVGIPVGLRDLSERVDARLQETRRHGMGLGDADPPA